VNRLARLSGARRWWWGGAVGALIVAMVLVWALWPSSSGPQPRARQYLAFTACLLTGADGVGGADAAPVWAGMRDASARTRAKVEYLSVSGPATKENAQPFLASLVSRHCDVVLVVGPAQVAALRDMASTIPAVRFVAIGGDVRGSNVTRIDLDSPERVRAAVRDAVVSAVRR
jgi:basic membrane lipoprotein Med (substrate-binding protein (PBP1-ABC) superfamily)